MYPILGIDYGTKRIGLAIGDSGTKTAVVFGVVNNAQAIKEIIERENINVIVVGAPYSVANVNYELPENWQKFLAERNTHERKGTRVWRGTETENQRECGV